MSGTSAEIVLGTPKEVVRTRDVRVIPDPEDRWNPVSLLNCTTAFVQCVGPREQLPGRIVTSPSAVVHDRLPEMPEIPGKWRRMSLVQQDVRNHG